MTMHSNFRMKRPEAMSREELEDEVFHLRDQLGRANDTKLGDVFARRWRLTERESTMLGVLYAAKGHVRRREALFDALYGFEDAPNPKILDVFISRLRAKIGHAKIMTSRGRGYSLAAEAVAEIDALLAMPPQAVQWGGPVAPDRRDHAA